MGQCQYHYNPSEVYQRTKPGMGVETTCGARTYPATDEPEMMAFPQPNGSTVVRATGRMLTRGYDDPYCPAHGGTEPPPPPPVTVTDLEAAYNQYMSLAGNFKGEGTIPVAPDPYALAAGQLTSGSNDGQQ